MLCSIIIPHHNLLPLLVRCLDSIPDDSRIEVIVVDDNSNSETVEGLKQLQIKSNVRILYTKEGRGAGYARNKGLESASGKWLLFCDSDDYFNPNMVDCIVKYADTDYDVVFFGFDTVTSDSLSPIPSRVIGSAKAFRNKDIGYFKYRFHGPWAKLIRKSLVDQYKIKFDETICSNDTFFSGLVGFHCSDPIIDSFPIYVTTIRQGSLVNAMTMESLFVRIDVSLRYNAFLKEIKKNKYRINILSLIFYLHSIDTAKFREYLSNYLHDESLFNILMDGAKCVSGFVKHKMNRKNDLRKQIKIQRND